MCVNGHTNHGFEQLPMVAHGEKEEQSVLASHRVGKYDMLVIYKKKIESFTITLRSGENNY